MKKTILLLLFVAFTALTYAQFTRSKKEFIQGEMIKGTDTLKGYFWFNPSLTQNGQEVHYRINQNGSTMDRFQSRKYDVFVGENVYLKLFPAIRMGIGGLVKIMVPRILDGKLQLYGTNIATDAVIPNITGSTKFYFIVKDGQDYKITKKDFEKMISTLIDDGDLLSSFKEKERNFDNIENIVAAYNKKHQ